MSLDSIDEFVVESSANHADDVNESSNNNQLQTDTTTPAYTPEPTTPQPQPQQQQQTNNQQYQDEAEVSLSESAMMHEFQSPLDERRDKEEDEEEEDELASIRQQQQQQTLMPSPSEQYSQDQAAAQSNYNQQQQPHLSQSNSCSQSSASQQSQPPATASSQSQYHPSFQQLRQSASVSSSLAPAPRSSHSSQASTPKSSSYHLQQQSQVQQQSPPAQFTQPHQQQSQQQSPYPIISSVTSSSTSHRAYSTLPPPVPLASTAPQPSLPQTDRCARVWSMLWHPSYKLRISIPDTIVFCNGAYHSYLFTSTKHTEIRRRKMERHGVMSMEEVRETLVQRTEKDASNVTPYVGIVQLHDSHSQTISYTSLPRVLRSISSSTRAKRTSISNLGGGGGSGGGNGADENGTSTTSTSAKKDTDVYQIVRTYIHPLQGVRYVTTYECRESGTQQHHQQQQQQQNPYHYSQPPPPQHPQHTLSTSSHSFSSRYEVLSEDRAFYDSPSLAALAATVGVAPTLQHHTHASSDSALHQQPPPDSITRECERITLCIIEWLSRLYHLQCTKLQLEFIQDYSKKLILHAVVGVEFDTSMTAANGSGGSGSEQLQPTLGRKLLDMTNEEEKENDATTFARPLPPTQTSRTTPAYDANPIRPYNSTPATRTNVRPASASARSGRHGRVALAGSASSAGFSASGPSQFQQHQQQQQQYTPPQQRAHTHSRPSSARPPSSSGIIASSSRSSHSIEQAFRNTQPPRSISGIANSNANSTSSDVIINPSHIVSTSILPRTSRAKQRDAQAKASVQFATLMKFESQLEMDERMSKGGSTVPGIGTTVGASPDGTSNPSNAPPSELNNRADFLLFHWRHQARSAHDEILRLNSELDSVTQDFTQKEQRLQNKLQMEERKTQAMTTMYAGRDDELARMKIELDSIRTTTTDTQIHLENALRESKNEVEVKNLLIKRLESDLKKQRDELLLVNQEKQEIDQTIMKIESEKREIVQAKTRVENDLSITNRIRDELLEKLEMEERFSRNLAQQLDLMADFDAFEDMRHLFQKAAGLARNEGNRLAEVENLRSQVIKYTKDRVWQEKKSNIQKQVKVNKKQAQQMTLLTGVSATSQNGAGGGGGGMMMIGDGSNGSGGGNSSGTILNYNTNGNGADSARHSSRSHKSHGGGGGGGGAYLGGNGNNPNAQMDPVPERRATDIIYERALNRMAH